MHAALSESFFSLMYENILKSIECESLEVIRLTGGENLDLLPTPDI